MYGALDEGCSATCHSKAWGRLAEQRLKAFNLSFPWMDATAKSFAGLGSTTKALGKRKLRFCLSLDQGDDTLAGVIESHEVNTDAKNPLLISLFAQATTESRSALVAASSHAVMANAPPIAGPATRPVDLSI